jgi:pimeloyl-ACP methyl ester carboxylesterase
MIADNSHHNILSNENDADAFREIYFTSNDGLTLYSREYATHHTEATPVVCLHGFTGNSQDFHEIAQRMAQGRRVIVPDLRGRGRSDYARDKKTYSVFHEMLDVLDLMLVAGVHQAVILGTSRGGLIAMLMAAYRPTAIKAVILNDIGPVIEHKGLLRMSGQLNSMPKPTDWREAGEIMARAHAHCLPGLKDDDWLELAHKRFKQTDGGIVSNYDPALAETFSLEVSKAQLKQRTFWPLFTALTAYPGLLLRGELSEFLSARTAEKMAGAHQNLDLVTVKNRGHVPLLNEPGVVKAIDALIARA